MRLHIEKQEQKQNIWWGERRRRRWKC